MSRKRKPFLRALIFALIMMVLINVPHVYREGWTVENIIQIIFVFLFRSAECTCSLNMERTKIKYKF